jgi:hypothetical protein
MHWLRIGEKKDGALTENAGILKNADATDN